MPPSLSPGQIPLQSGMQTAGECLGLLRLARGQCGLSVPRDQAEVIYSISELGNQESLQLRDDKFFERLEARMLISV